MDDAPDPNCQATPSARSCRAYPLIAGLVFVAAIAATSVILLKHSKPSPETPREEGVRAFADAQDRFINPDVPEYRSQRHLFSVRFPQAPTVVDGSTESPFKTTLYQALVDGQGFYSVSVDCLDDPISSDEQTKALLDAHLWALRFDHNPLRAEYVLLLGKRALTYEYGISVGEQTMCFKGVSILGRQFGYEVGVLFREDVRDAVLPHYRAFVSSFRVSPSTGADP